MSAAETVDEDMQKAQLIPHTSIHLERQRLGCGSEWNVIKP